MGGRLEPQPFCFASLNDTQPDGPNFQPFCSIQSVMMIWAAHSRSCKSKAVQLWQKLALDYACQWICREKLKYVKIIRVHWEKRGRTLQCFMVVCYSIFFFSETQMDWTMHLVEMEQDMVRRWSRTQFGFFFPLHMQPTNGLFILWKPTVLSEEMPLLMKLLFIAITTQLQK